MTLECLIKVQPMSGSFLSWNACCIYANKHPLSNKCLLSLSVGKRWPNAIQNGFRTLTFWYICPYYILRTSFLGLLNCSAPGARIRINMVYLGTLPKVACNVKNAFAVSFVVEVKNICCFGSNFNVQGCHKIGPYIKHTIIILSVQTERSWQRSPWPIFHGPVILSYILKTIWYMNTIRWDYESVWPDVRPENKYRSLWPIFHGPVILPYILKTLCCLNNILRDYESVWLNICKCWSLWPIFHGPVIFAVYLENYSVVEHHTFGLWASMTRHLTSKYL